MSNPYDCDSWGEDGMTMTMTVFWKATLYNLTDTRTHMPLQFRGTELPNDTVPPPHIVMLSN